MSQLPEATHRYLSHPSLGPLWSALRGRLERNGLRPQGTLTVELDETAADRLSGLLGIPVSAGRPRIRLSDLDAALLRSAAASGLVDVVSAMGGAPLIDRAARRAADRAQSETVWAALETGLAHCGLANAEWVPAFLADLRRSGILTRAGADAARAAVRDACATLAALHEVGHAQEPTFELAALASRCTGDAHGLDDGRLAAALVLRAAAAAHATAVPASAAARRELWTRLGVVSDLVSGTVITWGLRPHGDDAWSAMLRARADLGLVTHLTLHELRGAAAGVRLVPRDTSVFACENPQVLQAAARAGAPHPLVCFSGNPAGAGWALLRGLVGDGARVRYHGDFDWPGVAIAGRLFAAGAVPWRMNAQDYVALAREPAADARLSLSGAESETAWDFRLAEAMREYGVAVHEEAMLDVLLADLCAAEPGQEHPQTPRREMARPQP